jgi:hypothetical protein
MLQPAVVEQVLRFGTSKRVAEHLLRASQTDLSNPKARQAFEEHAPAVVQKLALLDSEKIDFVSFSIKMVEIDEEATQEVGVSLNNRGRVAALILKDVCGCAIEDLLKERVTELTGKIRENTRVAFERIEGSAGPTSSGPPEILFIRIDVDSVEYERLGPSIEFTFDGNFEADLSASLVQDNFDGVGLDEVQGDAQVYGTFSFDATWYFSASPGDVDKGECWIKSWKDNIDYGGTS